MSIHAPYPPPFEHKRFLQELLDVYYESLRLEAQSEDEVESLWTNVVQPRLETVIGQHLSATDEGEIMYRRSLLTDLGPRFRAELRARL